MPTFLLGALTALGLVAVFGLLVVAACTLAREADEALAAEVAALRRDVDDLNDWATVDGPPVLDPTCLADAEEAAAGD